MSSTKSYLYFILEQLSLLDDISYRPMMGEYIIYYQEKIIGGIYDDRFLIKAVPSAINFMSDPIYETPYPGAKKMLLVENVDNREYLETLLTLMYNELPTPNRKKK